MNGAYTENQTAGTGISGLDKILNGGLPRGGIYLVEGEPGAGKTTLALQFSLEGLRQNEKVLYLALSETHKDLNMISRSHGWDIERLHVMESASEQVQSTSMFDPAEVELGQAVQRLRNAVDRIKPERLVLDSLSEFRILGQNSVRYRRELLALKQFLVSRGCTALLLDHSVVEDSQRSVVDGVVLLEMAPPHYGTDRRRLRVVKLRGKAYAGGFHDFIIEHGGLQVFPRLVAAEHRPGHRSEILHSGLRELDAQLGGGIRTGTSTSLIGAAGTGKSSIAMLFAASAIGRGERVLYYTFDERPETILERARGLKLDLEKGIEEGLLHLKQMDPAELTPGQFAHYIYEQVNRGDVSMVVIDSLNGYMNAMPDERMLAAQLHEMLSYLGQQGISAFVIVGQRGMGRTWETPVDTSYLADNIMLFHFFESEGEIRRSIAVLKQRSSLHEQTIRELLFTPEGLQIGEPLRQFHGVLSGTPVNIGLSDELKKEPHEPS